MNTKLRHAGTNVAEIVIVILILAALNFLSYKFFHRFDITATKQFTISKATKDALAKLDDPVSIEFFCSADLPPEIQLMRDDVRNTLDEYAAYGHGNIKLKVTDPGDDEKKKERAQNAGVQELQVQVMKKDQVSVGKAFFGLTMNYLDKSEAIPAIGSTAALEYELTTRLIKLTMAEKPKIGLFAGAFTTSQEQKPPSYGQLQQVLGGQDGLYEVVQLDPQRDTKLPEGLKAVIICGAWGMPDSLKYSLDQFLMKGGQVFVAMEPMMQAGQQMGGGAQAFPSLPTIEDQLKKYGVELEKKLIADPMCASAPIPTSFGTLPLPYPLWPEVGPSGFNKKFAAVSKLEKLDLPWCCPLKKFEVPDVNYTTVAQTSDKSFTISSPFNLDPQQDWQFLQTSSEGKGPFTIVAMLDGKIPSAFDAPPAPQAPPPTEEGQTPVTLTPEFDASQHVRQSEGQGRLIVATSAIAFSDNGLGQFQQNSLFVANLMDMLILGNDLLQIRSAPVTNRPLIQMTDAQKSFYRWLNVLAVPILLSFFGLALWMYKGRRRAAIQRKYSGM